MNHFVPPLRIHLCWFENRNRDARCHQIARELYELLHRPLVDDVVLRPGLEIPTEFGRDLESLLDSLGDAKSSATPESPADVRLVIAILDSASYRNPDQRRVIQERALERWKDASNSEVFLPILLDPRWSGVLQTGAQQSLAGIRVDNDAASERQRRWKLGSEVAVVACRALRRRLHEKDPPHPKVFISHAKLDGRELTLSLVSHLTTKSQVKVWFDETDVPRGEELGNQLRLATSDGIVLVVRTDSYSESPWCALELLTAKLERTPILTLLATSEGEALASAYGGNHRTMNWAPGREWEVAARCVQAWLHGHHFRAHARAALARAGLPAGSEIVPRRPELMDLLTAQSDNSRPLLIYPDPPLTEDELQVLRRARPGVRLATPSTLLGRVLLANDPRPPLTGTTIAFSLSVAEDLPRVDEGRVGRGITQQHLDDALYSIVLATLNSGARIAYGGDLRNAQGYAKRLSDLHRSRRRLGTGATSQLTCFVDAATGDREGDGAETVEYEPVEVEEPDGASEFPRVRSILWHLALRDEMARLSSACVLLGGKARASVEKDDGGYVGPWPGLLEEAWRALEHGNALFIVGGFGGVSGVIAKMLEQESIPPELTATHHAAAPLERLVSEVDVARTSLKARGANDRVLLAEHDGSGFAGIEQLAARILARWTSAGPDRKGWGNELSDEENRTLFHSTDRTEIAHLVFEGLRRRAARRESKVKLAVYHGDIASVPQVDAYAVSITPGIRPAGASDAIDKRLGGRLSDHPWTDDRQVIAAIPVHSAALAGSHVLVARLSLLPAGSTIDAKPIEEIGRWIAAEADRLGLESVAVVPFGTTMGLSVADSVNAMVNGFKAGGGLPKTFVFCETDRARYARLCEALRVCSAEEVPALRAGPAAAPARTDTILNVDVIPPTSEEPYGRFRATMIVPDVAAPIVPLHEGQLTWPFWYRFRDRYTDPEQTRERGKLLWETVLDADMRKALAAAPDRRLVVIADEGASGLPWEIMTDDQGKSLALTGGIIRRIALSGSVRQPPPQTGTGARLRVLLVSSPGGLRSVGPELEEIRKALAGRADVVVEPTLVDPDIDTLRDQLRHGFYDVLHYAGHASFDPDHPESSGLALRGGVFTAEHLAEITSPRMVFLSACESGRVRKQEQTREPLVSNGRPLALAFLRHGVAALVGTFFAVDDRAARAFAADVYTELAAGQPLGSAVRTSRRKRSDANDPDWANFLLYGDDGLVI